MNSTNTEDPYNFYSRTLSSILSEKFINLYKTSTSKLETFLILLENNFFIYNTSFNTYKMVIKKSLKY